MALGTLRDSSSAVGFWKKGLKFFSFCCGSAKEFPLNTYPRGDLLKNRAEEDRVGGGALKKMEAPPEERTSTTCTAAEDKERERKR